MDASVHGGMTLRQVGGVRSAWGVGWAGHGWASSLHCCLLLGLELCTAQPPPLPASPRSLALAQHYPTPPHPPHTPMPLQFVRMLRTGAAEDSLDLYDDRYGSFGSAGSLGALAGAAGASARGSNSALPLLHPIKEVA